MLRRLSGGRGDTIVEVMIVLSILGFALGVSYATASRSLSNTRQAEEHAQAIRYAQSDIEVIRSIAKNGTNNPAAPNWVNPPNTNIWSQNQPFCPSNSTPPLTTYSALPAPGNCLINGQYTHIIYNCNQQPTVPVCAGTLAGSNTYVAQVLWPDATGDGIDTVTLSYIVGQP